MSRSFSIEPDARTLRGYFSPDLDPVLTVDPGDIVHARTVDALWSSAPHDGPWEEFPRIPEYSPEHGDGHALIGPIAVRGAKPGDVLAVSIDEVIPGAYGTTFAGGYPDPVNQRFGIEQDGITHSWRIDATTGTARNQHGIVVPTRPFLGVMGMPPAEPGRHSTSPPRVSGGNLDCKELVAGSTLYLPVPVEGALFSFGDGHAAQGDGEVSGSAIECPMDRVQLRFDLHRDWELRTPVAHTPAGWLTLGLGDTLDAAALSALEAMFALLGRLHGLTRHDAIALSSVTVNLRITQIVNGTVGVHAILPPAAFTAVPTAP